MHQNKGKTVAKCLSDRIDYALNPQKTENGKYVTAYECDPKTIVGEWMLDKREYEYITGRVQASNVIAYQIRQSFKPSETTPEQANQIGYEVAMRFTKGHFAFVVATHTDHAHIHNHVIFNSTALDCTRKFHDFKKSGLALAKVSDLVCLENQLSVIENPQYTKSHYGKWLGDQKPISFSEKLRQTIDAVLSQNPLDFEDFLKRMQSAGYEVKQGKHVAFKGNDQKKFIRLRSLGEGYDADAIKAMINGERALNQPKKAPEKASKKASQTTRKKTSAQPQKHANLLIDIQSKLQQGKGKGYEKWATVFNLKQMAKTLNFLTEHQLLSLEDLDEKTNQATLTFDQLSTQIKTAEKRMAEVAVLQKHIRNYMQTRDVYIAYRKSGYAKKFLDDHRAQITLHKAAKDAFDALHLQKLPNTKNLQEEYASLLSQKKQAYIAYHTAKKEKQELLLARENVKRFLHPNEERHEKEPSRN